MTVTDFDIRTMTPADLDLAVEWAAREGWNPGLHDAEAFRAADPDGFLMGWLGSEPVGCVSVVAYGETFGFLGFYIVRPEFRGRGYGLRIWRAGMDRLADRNIGLDGVVAQQDNYRRSGFRYAYANERFEGIGGGVPPGGVVDLTVVSFKQISDYDSAIFRVPRESFLKGWIAPVGGHALGVVKGRELVGYGVMRPCRKGHKIGPLFADTPEIADCLFNNLIAEVSGETVYLDVPRPNAAAVALVKRHGMNSVFETARMYTREDPGVPVERVFGVTTFELG
jgi:GNAT superfamily N-acetyltransferase